MRVSFPFHPQFYHRVKVRLHSGQTRTERLPRETTYFHQLRAFAQAVRGGPPMATDANDAVANMRVIDAVYEKAGLKQRGT